jgi:hypothetical protein
MKITSECTIVALVLAAAAQPSGQSELDCMTRKVTITNGPAGTISARTEERLTFVINDEARIIAFSDGRQLRVSRFEQSWITAEDHGIQYDFNRSDETLSYAGSRTEGNTTTTIVGSGRCEIVPMKT